MAIFTENQSILPFLFFIPPTPAGQEILLFFSPSDMEEKLVSGSVEYNESCLNRALKGQFWILGSQWKKLGSWDLPPFEIGILEIRCEIGILDLLLFSLCVLCMTVGHWYVDFGEFLRNKWENMWMARLNT